MATPATIDLDGQYRILREGAGLVDRSSRRMLLVEGTDAAEFLQGQVTNDVEALGPGQGCYAALLDRKGHLQADMRLLRLDEGTIWLDTEPEPAEAVRRHLDMYRVGREVEVTDPGTERALLSLIGPRSAEVAGAPPLPSEHDHAELTLGGVACRAVATDLGLDVICAAADAPTLRAALLASEAAEVSEDAAEILRVETGRPRFGRDMTSATMPEEAGIADRAVSFTKGCYIGQETVARLHYRGKPNRRLRGLQPDSPIAAGEPVRLGERELGTVGTAVLSPARGPLALAILRREAEPGARVVIGDGVEAEVVELPFPAPA